jgi:arylsulfatase A-like enzyme
MKRIVTRREFLKLAGASGAMALAGGSLSSYSKQLPIPGIIRVDPDKYGIIILADGLRADLFFEMLEAGKLPHIKDRLVDRGAVAECTTTLPSTTGPAHLPFLTGTFPGRNHVTGIRWMDRQSGTCRDYCSGLESVMIDADYGLQASTLFEVLHEEETAVIYDIVTKGATHIKRPAGVKEAWWVKGGEWEQFDARAADLVEELYERQLPRFTFVWMPGIDHLSHFEGPTSERVRGSLVNVDNQIERIARVLEKHHIYDKTLIGLVADHGLRDNQHHLNLAPPPGANIPCYLEFLGLKVKPELGPDRDWTSIHRYNAVVAVSGNAFVHIYVCSEIGPMKPSFSKQEDISSIFDSGWKWKGPVCYEELRKFPIGRNREINLIEELLDKSGVGLVLCSEQSGRRLVLSSSGQSAIEIGFEGCKYSVVKGDDPLGYADVPDTAALMDGGFHSSDEWLRASCASTYPDAVVQITQLFKSHRCGDMVVLAAPGYDLMDEGHIGSHGSLEREEMLVPVVLAGPGIVNKRLEYARTVDVFPTYLEFFGISAPIFRDYIDGRTLDVFA